MSDMANILIGCGGSGIKTLMRLNELLSEDHDWRHRVDESIYYLLIDTDLDDLNSFSDEIAGHMLGARRPYVGTIPLTQDIQILKPYIDEHFVEPYRDGKGDATGRERLYSHWWSNAQGEPFYAPRVRNVVRGAGQCPPVSYFLAWKNLRKIEDAFENLIKELTGRRSGRLAEPGKAIPLEALSNLNIIVVAGLAGGTGRGCWEVLSFKMRELFNRYGTIASPVAFLFDSSCYHDIARKFPNQKRQLTANSLTGLSQLSCWVRNKDGKGDRFAYRLPDMGRPEVEEMDVLHAELDLDDANAAPVDHSFVIFGRNEAATLANHDQYHEMVGQALYARITQSQIRGEEINEYHPYWSPASATFEVAATRLRKYFEIRARIRAIVALREHRDSDVDGAVEQFLEESNLVIGIDTRRRSGFRADPQGTLLQRACKFVQESKGNPLALLDRGLREDNPSVEEAQSYLPAILSPNAGEVRDAIQSAVESIEDPVAVARQSAERVLRSTRSLQAVADFVRGVTSQLKEELQSMPSADDFKLPQEDDPELIMEARGGREFLGLFGPRFNDDECNEILDNVQAGLLYKHYAAIRDELERVYQGWIAQMEGWAANSALILDQGERVCGRFKADVRRLVGEGGGEAFDEFFTDATCPEESLPDKFSLSRFYRRNLKPVVERGAQDGYLPPVEIAPQLREWLVERTFEAPSGTSDSTAIDRLRSELHDHITSTVHVGEDTISLNFNLAGVIRGLCEAWKVRLEEARGDRDRFVELAEQFRNFFGVEPAIEGGKVELPPDREFLLNMASSLSATSRPYWQLRRGEKDSRVAIFLPAHPEFDTPATEEEAEDFIKERLGNREVDVICGRNPFVLLTYTAEGVHDFDSIASADYWREDSQLLTLLEKAETIHGDSIFDLERSNGGVGFVDPIYVRNETLRERRWRPWARTDVSDRERFAVGEALIYALLEPDAELTQVLDRTGWRLPLVRIAANQTFEFARHELEWDEERADQARERLRGRWREGDRLGQRVWRVARVLRGEEEKTGPTDPALGVVWRDNILRESREFWDEIAPPHGYGPGTLARRSLLEHQLQRLNEFTKSATEDQDRELWEQLMNLVQGKLDG